jgi:hypothetical protein
MSTKKNSGKKCIAIHLPVDLLDKINEYKEKTGLSQSRIMIDFIEKGLNISRNDKGQNKLFFFVKVRIDTTKMMEFGQKLQSGELDTSHTIMTYCVKDDPTVGISFWQSDSQKSFEEVFAQHRRYYKEVVEIIPVTTPSNAMILIIEKMQKQ